MRRFWQLAFLVLFGASLALFSSAVWGQATTSLRGTVTDPSGAAVPNATVHLVDADTSVERTAKTDQQGGYVFAGVQPGNYVLRVDAAGFSTYEQKGFQLLVNLPATINVPMKVGAANTTVEVTAQAPLLNTTDASQGNTMAGSQIADMPLYGRNVTQLLSVQPGVVFTSNRTDMAGNDTRSGSVNGAHSDQNNITLDGVDVNDQGNGSPFETVVPVTVASVEEFRVTTADYGADQGRSSGAQSALVTKGGTNNFHGQAYEYNRTDFGEANDFFNKNAEQALGASNKPLHLVYNIFGADIGGPIKHDRAFFFFNYEGHRQNEAVTAQRSIPSPTLADGIIQYPCATASQCPGGTFVTGASGKNYPVTAGDFAIGPNSNSGGLPPGGLTQMDPLTLGPSKASMAYFQTYLANPAVARNPNNDPIIGDGLGLNFDGFLFAPVEDLRDDILIGRIDYKLTANGSQTLFWRGSGQDNYVPGEASAGATSPPGGTGGNGAPLLPGGVNQGVASDFSKGMVAGYTVLFGANVVNNFRYGFTRQSIASTGDSSLPANFIRNLSQDEGNYTNEFNFPVHEFTDDVSWTKGKHTFTFGGDFILTLNNSLSNAASFSSGSTNAAWIDTGGFAETGSPFDPDNYFPAIESSFDTNYDFPLIGLLGMVTEVNAQYQNHANADGSAVNLPEGTVIPRHFKMHEGELYAQDSFKIKPNFTFNYGVRFDQITAPWETSGQESAPTQDLGTWFEERGQGMMRGVPANQAPIVSFDLAGRSNGRPDWWPDGNTFSPRISIAWSPEPSSDWLNKLVGGRDKTVIRAGFGKYVDHYGQAMIETFDTSGGEFGLSALIINPANVESASSSARWAPISGQPLTSAINNIPDIIPAGMPNAGQPYTDPRGDPLFTPQPPLGFPATLAPGNFCICWGIDSSLKTPYSYALDFSISRELPHNMAIEVAYVGRLGHNILLQSDLAQPLNLRDPTSGITYYQAAAAMATLGRAKTNPTAVTTATIGPTGAYWNDLFQPVAAGDEYDVSDTIFGAPGQSCGGQPLADTTDTVTAIYETYLCSRNNETNALSIFDTFGIQGANTSNVYTANTGNYTWFDSQYSSLFAWRSQGWSHYNSMQVTFKKQMSQGVEFNLNYTYSTSFDLASDAESVGEDGALSGNVVNPWMGDQLSGPSDFDLRHQVNAQYIWQLPFGQGRPFASHIGKGLDAVIGGWEISGLTRWSSGFPVSGQTCFCFPTNWQLTGDATSSVQISGSHFNVPDPSGTVTYNVFNNPAAVFNDIGVPLPGTSGSRNPFRGDGFLNTDMELGKTWKMPYNESHSLKFTADMFNVFNMNRFDVQSAASNIAVDSFDTFGDYTRLLTLPRVMQFGLLYNF